MSQKSKAKRAHILKLEAASLLNSHLVTLADGQTVSLLLLKGLSSSSNLRHQVKFLLNFKSTGLACYETMGVPFLPAQMSVKGGK